MRRLLSFRVLSIFLLVAGALGVSLLQGAKDAPTPAERAAATKLYQDGNYNDAYKKFRAMTLNEANSPKEVVTDLALGVQCLRNLGRTEEFDEYVEATIAAHKGNWRLLQQAAHEYLNIDHFGFQIGGKYARGGHRGGGKLVNSQERDRVRALQLLTDAIPLAQKDDSKSEVADFFVTLSNQLLANRGYTEAWRLQYLANLAELPDYDEGYYFDRQYNGAPVDAEGKPVFHRPAKSWADAKSDGERWRWALEQAVENDPSKLNRVRMMQAEFYQAQFGPESMSYGQWGGFFGLPVTDDDTKKDESGTYALHTLKETETIAKLATGIKRFELEDEFNYIRIFQKIAAEPKTGYADAALQALATAFENRRQFPTAATLWQESIDKHGDPQNGKKLRREQIVNNWGRFEAAGTQPAGKGATIEFRFRNAKKANFTAQAIKADLLLKDVKAYLKSDPGQLDWNKLNLEDIGHRLVHLGEAKYVGEEVAKWSLDLEPREKHFDRRITVTTPLQKAGAYLLTATLPDGNVSKAIVWVADTAIVHKQLSDKHYYFVADAAAGTPVAKANLEFFGYQQEHLGGNRFRVKTKNFAETADKDGQVMPDGRDLDPNYQWLVSATDKGGRFAHLGFSGVWVSPYYDAQYNEIRIFGITDRPVYRPDNKVQFKCWVRRSQYDQPDTSDFAKKSVTLEIHNPKGEKVLSQNLQSDEYGGVLLEYALPKDATLGVYSIAINCFEKNNLIASGGNTFRVEEYKKPEFEVTIEAPKEPVMLGEKITAKVQAKYLFGSPVTKAKVKYKVLRSNHSQDWYPKMPWDWCYGPGYWWFAYDYHWYPGFEGWSGCCRPAPWWWHGGNHQPPEVIAEQEVEIGADGTISIEIDTQVAKELHGNTDHSYSITAEVRDESRRTIVGSGNVLVARKPFKVYTWLKRGYYRVGDTIDADFLAQTLDNKPVTGKGELTLLKITYNKDAQPIETPVRRWSVDTNVEGRATQQIAASAKGQYRLAYNVTDSKEHKIEGGYLFTIIGDGFDGHDYRFNNVELIPEKAQYNPGEKVKLQINTSKADSTVLLFVRPANGIYLPPRVIRMKGKSAVEEIDVVKKDMPNFFIEAMTVADAQVYQETKEVVVPPEKRVLNVAVLPSAKEYKPGEEATIKVHVTDHTGENFSGSTVVTIYDKAVEYISGGSNVPDIKEFFWKWRREHQPSNQNSLARYAHNMTLPNMAGMGDLGAFGGTIADELGDLDDLSVMREGVTTLAATANFSRGGRQSGLGGLGGMPLEESAMAMDAAKSEGAAPPAPTLAPPGVDPAANKDGGGTAGAAQMQQPTVRSNFADTALWAGALTTDKTGIAEVKLKMPENLTGWKIKVWTMGHGTRVGSGEAEVVTRKNVLVRLQAPRFFVQKDEVVLSANVHNYLKTDKEVEVSLEIPGQVLTAMGELTQKVKIKAGGEQRVDWRVKVAAEGEAIVRMKALTDEESDAMEMKLPSYVHGMLKQEAWAGTVRREDKSSKVTINVPGERRVEQSVLEIRYSPTLAGAMVDALPYLAEYPYGCTEQTLNRFLPSAVTQKVLREMNVDLAAIRDKRTNLNAQEIGDDKERAKQWKRFDRNPVFDEAELNRMVKEGLTALTNMQCADGGWGWFSGFGERSFPHTTAVVVHGLQVAKANDQALVPGVLERGIEWLKRYQADELQKIKNAPNKVQPWKENADDMDAFVYMILVDADLDNNEMRDFLYRDRTKIGVYSKAMFGLALHKVKDQEKLDMILKNIEQFLVQDAENETAYLKLPQDVYWWYWYGSETEANAYYLKLLAKTDPKGQAPGRLVKYLLNNRKHSTYWNSTRDTALCVEAFADYIRATGENKPDMVVEIHIDGQKRKEVQIKPEDLFTFDNKLVLTGADVKDGKHEIEIIRRGEGPLYYNAYLTNFTLEDDIKKAGLEIKVERKYYQLKRVAKTEKVEGQRGQVVDQKVEKYERVPLDNLAQLKSGDLVEIELEFESKNDYEYILFEDMKPAGFETIDVRSGYVNNGLGAYMEVRDNRVAFFVRALARGKNSISYRMHAETPGQFAALPAKVSAMYAPELKGNSDEIKLKVQD